MTRIRITEWLMAIILVVGLHGAALTAWIWMAPVSTTTALPAPTPAKEVVDADAIDIAITLIEPNQSPEGLAVATPVASQPAPVSPSVAVAEAAPNDAQTASPAVPLEPLSQPQPVAPQAPVAALEQPGPAVLQDPVAPQATVVPQEPVAPQAPALQPGPAVLQDDVFDPSKDNSQISEAVPLPAESLPVPVQNQPGDTVAANAGTTDVAALPAQAVPPLSAEPAVSPQQLDAQPQPATPVSRSPLRDPAPIPRAKPAVRTVAPPPDEPSIASSGEQVAAIGTEDPAEPDVNVLAPDRPETDAQRDYFRNLVSRITGALIYPDEAIQAGKEGIVDLQIVVKKDGRIASYDIIASSGHKELDDAAIQTLIKVNPVPPFPRDVTKDELRISVPLRYLIDRS